MYLILGSYRIWILPDLPDSDFAGFEIFKSGNPAGIPAGTFSPDYPAGLLDYRILKVTKVKFLLINTNL